jgi:hypothetical protein
MLPLHRPLRPLKDKDRLGGIGMATKKLKKAKKLAGTKTLRK